MCNEAVLAAVDCGDNGVPQLEVGLLDAWLARAQGFTVSEIRDHLDAILKELP